MFFDILHPVVPVGLTRDSTFPFSLILVDAYSCYACIYGIWDKGSSSVIDALTRYQADHGRRRGERPMSFCRFDLVEFLEQLAGVEFSVVLGPEPLDRLVDALGVGSAEQVCDFLSCFFHRKGSGRGSGSGAGEHPSRMGARPDKMGARPH